MKWYFSGFDNLLENLLVPVILISPAPIQADSLQSVQLLSNLLNPSAIDQLMKVQGSPTMWALRPLFSQPPPDAHIAAKFGAMRAQVSIPEFFHANEASEDLSQ